MNWSSETIGELTKALSKAQGVMSGAPKSSENPFFKSKYADLAAVWDTCREPLAKNGLAVIQLCVPGSEPNKVAVNTILAHESGEWVSGTIEMTPTKNDPQAVGSAITYARRYGLQAIVGIAPEDDDGNAASATNGDTSAVHWPKTLTKAEVQAKKDAGLLKGQRVEGRVSEEVRAEAEAEVMGIGNPDKTFEQVLAEVPSKVAAKIESERAQDSGSMFHGTCDHPGCSAVLVTGVSESEKDAGREYWICHWAAQEKQRMKKEGFSDKSISIAIKEHTRMWKKK